MENLTSEDHGPSSGPSSGPQATSAQPVVPQLPPQMFTTAAQLLDLTDSEFSMASTKPAIRKITEYTDLYLSNLRKNHGLVERR